MFVLGTFNLGDSVNSIFIGIMLAIDSVIYGLINSSFKIFMALAGARLLSSDVYTSIANKIYIIIGVVMLFVLAYAIIRAIIDPDQMAKGDLSAPKIIKNVVVAVIGLAIAPVLFNMMYQAQSLFLEHDVLVKLFFRGGEESFYAGNVDIPVDTSGGSNSISQDIGEVNPDEQIKVVGGGVTSVSLWRAFFFPSANNPDDIEANIDDYFGNVAGAVVFGVVCALSIVGTIATAGLGSLLFGAAAVASCTSAIGQGKTALDKVDASKIYGENMTLSEAYIYASESGDFGVFSVFSDFVVDGSIKYHMWVSTIAGAFVCYAFVSFSIDMGIRAAKLAYYQIIAPIPLILQVLPKWKDTFSKYLREVINTFIEVFVRISVVYIIVYIICHLENLFSDFGSLFSNDNLNGGEALIAYALLIIGLVIFAKQAPKMISETFGLKSGSMSLGIGKKLQEGGVYSAGQIAGSALKSGIHGFTDRWSKGPKVSEQKGFFNKAKTALGNFARSSGSFMWRSADGAVRSAPSAWNGGKFVSSSDVGKNINNVVEKADDYRMKKDEFNRLHPTVGSKVHGHLDNAKKAIKTWSTPQVDVSSLDEQMYLYDQLMGLKGKLESTVSNDDEVKEAQRRFNQIESERAYALGKEKEKKRSNVESEVRRDLFRDRNVGENDTDYNKEFNAWLAKDDNGEKYKKEKNERNASIDRMTETDISDSVLMSYADDYRSYYTEIEDKLKSVTQTAISRKLAEESLGLSNDTIRALENVFADTRMIKAINTYSDADIGGGRTVGEYLKELLGEKILESGTINFSNLLQQQARGSDAASFNFENIEFEKDGSNPITLELSGGFSIKADKISSIQYNQESSVGAKDDKFTMTYTDSAGNVQTKKLEADDIEALKGKIKKIGKSTGGSKSKVAKAMKDLVEPVSDKFRRSEEYKTAQERKRAASKDKDKK